MARHRGQSQTTSVRAQDHDRVGGRCGAGHTLGLGHRQKTLLDVNGSSDLSQARAHARPDLAADQRRAWQTPRVLVGLGVAVNPASLFVPSFSQASLGDDQQWHVPRLRGSQDALNDAPLTQPILGLLITLGLHPCDIDMSVLFT